MHEDLEWLAENVSEWGGTYNFKHIFLKDGRVYYSIVPDDVVLRTFTRDQWQAARNELEDQFSSPEEDEAWAEAEKRMDAIGQNGGTGEHYESPASKYHVQIKGQWVDVYDILTAYSVTNPADAHAIKKMLCPGRRGAKDGIQDRQEAIASLERAIELEGGV
jgi:hypothetical protein